MKIKLLSLIVFISSFYLQAQITTAEVFATGTKIAFYPNQCGNTIPEAAGKLTFCDKIENLGIVERSYGLNYRGVDHMLSNHFNEDEVYITRKGLSIRNTNGSWENIPEIAIPTYNDQGDWTNIAEVQNGLVLPDGKMIIQSTTNIGPIVHVYDRVLKTFTPVVFPSNRFPEQFAYDEVRNLTWILARAGGGTGARYLYSYDGATLNEVSVLPELISSILNMNTATVIYKDDYLYLGTNNGLFKMDITDYIMSNIVTTHYNTTTTSTLPFDRVLDLHFDSSGNLWLAQSHSNSDGGIVKFNLTTETYDLYQLELNTSGVNYAFQNIALDENDIIWTNASNYSGIMELTFTGNSPNWNLLSHTDIESFGVPMTYNPNNIYFRNSKVYFTTFDGSSGSNNNFEVVINDNNAWSGRNDNEQGNLSQRMNARFTGNMPDANGGVWWFNAYDDIVVYRDADDNHESILIENLGNASAIDADNKAIIKGGTPNEIRKINFPNANSIQNIYTEANDMKRVADQVWIYGRGDKKIEAYKDDALVHTYNLDEDWYLNSYYFAADDNGDAWFIRSYNGIEIKKFDTATLTTVTYDVSSIGSLGTLRKVVAAPNGGVWFMGTSGAVYQENGVFYDFLAADYPEISYLRDIVVDTNGKTYLLNSSPIVIIENPTDATPTVTTIDIAGNDTILPSLDHYLADALAIDSEGSIWTQASQNAFKLIDDDLATEYIAQPALNTTDYKLENRISIYPNPTNGIINIKSTPQIESVGVFSILGVKITTFKNTNEIDLSNQASGMYLLKIVIDGQIINKKIMVQ